VSSTNRGGRRSPADNYATPAWCVERLLEARTFPPGSWLEPAAGNGAIVTAVNRTDVDWRLWEIRSEERARLAEASPGARVRIGDFIRANQEGDLPLPSPTPHSALLKTSSTPVSRTPTPL